MADTIEASGIAAPCTLPLHEHRPVRLTRYASDDERTLRIGVLSAARIAEPSIVKPARAGGHRLVVVAARDRGRAEAFAFAHGVE